MSGSSIITLYYYTALSHISTSTEFIDSTNYFRTTSYQALLARLSGAASRHRIRVEECFSDFDRHRDGTVTVPQFNIGMQTAFGKYEALAEADFALLATSFGIAKPGAMHVQWKSFCQALEV